MDVHRATDAVLAQLDYLAALNLNLLFIATSNYPQAIDKAFLSRCDLIVSLELPSSDARHAILCGSIEAMGAAFPKMKKLMKEPGFEQVVALSEGLDGRRIRKLVASACTYSKETSLDPNRLTVSDLIRAVNHEQEEFAVIEEEN